MDREVEKSDAAGQRPFQGTKLIGRRIKGTHSWRHPKPEAKFVVDGEVEKSDAAEQRPYQGTKLIRRRIKGIHSWRHPNSEAKS